MWAEIYQNEIRHNLRLYLIDDLITITLGYFDSFASHLAPFQQRAFDACCVQRSNVFITGPAGTGKTFLLQAIVDRLRTMNQRVVVTASTGIAAIMIHGQTLHSFTKLIRLQQQDLTKTDDYDRQYWMAIYEEVDVLVIDEISMITPHDFSLLVCLWNDLGLLRGRGDRPPLQVIILGDFFQLPAVIKPNHAIISNKPSTGYTSKGPSSTYSNSITDMKTQYQYCFQTPEWAHLIERYVYLYDVFRQADQEFVRSLNAIRVGQFTAFDIERIQQRWIHHPKYHNDRPVLQFKDEYTWIFPTNEEADRHNQDIIARMPGDIQEYKAMFGYSQLRDGLRKTDDSSFEKFTSIENVPPNRAFYFKEDRHRKMFHVKERLQLQLGVRVLFKVNLRTEHGLVNGARGTVVGFALNKLPFTNNMILPIVKFDNGAIHHILLHEWQIIVERTSKQKVRAYLWMVQLPLRYAYATTVHQSQGQSLSNVMIAPRRIFQFGQGYVALSRARTLQDLHLLDPLQASMFRVNQTVQRFYESIV